MTWLYWAWPATLLLVIIAYELIWRYRYHKINAILINNCNKLQLLASELASVRVKHGQTWETFLPLMSVFEKTIGPKENAVFLGQPLDLIYFNQNEIVFVEVKTGNSRLSSKQRHIRDLVKDKKIRWQEVNDTLKPASSPDTDRISSMAIMKTIPHRPSAEKPNS